MSRLRGQSMAAVLGIAALVALPACHEDVLGVAQSENSSLGGGSAGAEAAALTTIAKALLKFHRDTGGWPYGETAWYAIAPTWRMVPNAEIDGVPFSPYDTALFAMPPDIVACDGTHTGGWSNPCWDGPYLNGPSTDALGSAPWLDQWQHQRMFAYIRPNDGLGGGIDQSESQEGLVFVWSEGPDGIDGFACTQGTCKRNVELLAQGLPSQKNADDIVIEVSNTSCATANCTE